MPGPHQPHLASADKESFRAARLREGVSQSLNLFSARQIEGWEGLLNLLGAVDKPRWDDDGRGAAQGGWTGQRPPLFQFSPLSPGSQENLEAIHGGSLECQTLSQTSHGLVIGFPSRTGIHPHSPIHTHSILTRLWSQRTQVQSPLCFLLAMCPWVDLSMFPD